MMDLVRGPTPRPSQQHSPLDLSSPVRQEDGVYGQFFDRYDVAGFRLAVHNLRRGIGSRVFFACPPFQTQQRRLSTWCEDTQVHTLKRLVRTWVVFHVQFVGPQSYPVTRFL
jgi:hypothetical protein